LVLSQLHVYKYKTCEKYYSGNIIGSREFRVLNNLDLNDQGYTNSGRKFFVSATDLLRLQLLDLLFRG